MGYSNITNPTNYQLQAFGQSGVRTISTSQKYVEGEYYRVLQATQDSTISATSLVGDNLVSEFVYAGTTIYGIFSAVSVSSGELLAYLAGPTDIDDVWNYVREYGYANSALIEGEQCAKDAIEPLLDKYYAQASLVLVPSLYKTSIVYAERPLSTDGQFAFTRASDATRINSSGLIETVSSNVPRLDYTNSTCPRILLEGQRTNLLLQSNTFSTTWATGGGTMTSGQAGYDGSNNAWLFENAASTLPLSQSLSLTSAARTTSFYVKKNATYGIRMYAFGSSNTNAFFNLNTGSVVTVSGGTAQIEVVNSEWFRCSVSSTQTITQVAVYITNNATTQVLGSAIIQNSQLEDGASASSYIPTTTATVTRLQDILGKTGVGSLIGSPAGTIFADVQIQTLSLARTIVYLQATSYATYSIRIETNATNLWRVQIRDNSVTIYDATYSGAAFTTGRYKVALAYNTGTDGLAFYVNGTQLAQTTITAVPSLCTDIYIGSRTTSGSFFDFICQDSFNDFILFKSRLTNAQLAELTTL